MSATTIAHVHPPVSTKTSQSSQLTDSTITTTSQTSITASSSSICSNSESSDPLESDFSDGDVEDGENEDDDSDDDDNDIDKEHDSDDGEPAQDDIDNEENDDEEEEEDTDEEDDNKETAAPSKKLGNLECNSKSSSRENFSRCDEESDRSSSETSDTSKSIRDYSLDDFQIIKTIGTGTFGRVCLCKEKQTEAYYAMKILAMTDVIRLKQVDHVKNEKSILSEVKQPFIVNLSWSTKDDCCLYMLFEYVCGGELFSYLRNAGRFNSPTANFFASEIVLALEYLHSLSIVYRDLKPENLLINRDGHLKITDFGFAKKLKDRTWTLCGTPEYLAPEIIQSKGHNRAVDWWALGILIYEMLAGYPPFYDDNPFGIYEKILSGKIEWPRHIDPIAKDLVKKLLVLDRTKRMGNMKNGADDVKRHRWFKHLNWNDVLNKKVEPPIIPQVHFDGDTSNFDEYPETDWKPARSLDESDMQLFDDF